MVKGWPYLLGTRVRDAGDLPTEDPPAVERLRAHDAVILGKTNTPEFGWKGVTDSPRFGVTRNPWDTRMTPVDRAAARRLAWLRGWRISRSAPTGVAPSASPPA